MEQLNEALVNLLVTVIIAVLGLVSAYATLYINKLKMKADAEIQKIADEKTRAHVEKSTATIYDTLYAIIDKLESTMVKELKATSEDGKLTKEDQVKVANTAKDMCKEILNDDVLGALTTITTDTDSYILALVDSIVSDKKLQIKANNTEILNG